MIRRLSVLRRLLVQPSAATRTTNRLSTTSAIINREATMDDYHDVVEIAEVYNGRDYLPVMYEELVTYGKGYVTVIDGDIAAFLSVDAVDDGQTLVTRAGRIKKAYRGQGIHNTLTKYVLRQSLSDRVRYTAYSTNVLEYDAVKNQAEETCVKNVHCYRFKMKDLNQTPCCSNTEPRFLHKADLKEVFSSNATCKRVFPEGKMVAEWMPFRSLASNIDMIIKPHTTILASRDAGRSQDDVIYTCLTHGSYFRCKIGLAYSLDVFGDDVTKLRNHILTHFKCIGKQVEDENDDVSLCIFTPLNIERSDIDRMIADTDLPKYGDEQMYQKMRVFEKPLGIETS